MASDHLSCMPPLHKGLKLGIATPPKQSEVDNINCCPGLFVSISNNAIGLNIEQPHELLSAAVTASMFAASHLRALILFKGLLGVGLICISDSASEAGQNMAFLVAQPTMRISNSAFAACKQDTHRPHPQSKSVESRKLNNHAK